MLLFLSIAMGSANININPNIIPGITNNIVPIPTIR